MTEEFSPAINQSLPDGRVFRSSNTKVAVVPAVAHHLCAFIQHVLLRIYDVLGLPGPLSGNLDLCERALSGALRIGLNASHF
jgi:hypothetical protein